MGFRFCFGGQGTFSESSQTKLSPILREIIADKKGHDTPSIGVFIRTTDPEILREKGIHVRTIAGDIVTATVSPSHIEAISGLSSVFRIEAAAVCKPMLDESIPEMRVNLIQDGAFGHDFSGHEVIVGIYDSGIDWSHPDFIDDAGNSRILYLWDQTENSGNPPLGYLYGSQYTREDINDEIDGSPVGVVQGKDFWGHGSHVAGIAAGNGRATGNGLPSDVYIGVAPGADLIIVKGGDDFFMEDRIIDGIDYIFRKAESLNPSRPVVINLSVGGSHLGPHDATSGYERAIDNLLLGTTGRAIVIAAGNDGDDPVHFGKAFTIGLGRDTLTVTFSVDANVPGVEDFVSFDVWYPVGADLEVTVITPADTSLGPIGSDHSETWETGEGKIIVDNANRVNDNRELFITLRDVRSNEVVVDNLNTGSWKLLFAGLLYADSTGKFDGWLYESSMGAHIVDGWDATTLLAEPGNSRLSITVGSYTSRTEWPSLHTNPWGPGGLALGALSPFSSPGPTRDERQKPDIVAPGEYILSSLSSDIPTPPIEHITATDGVHWAMKGTSMSAPHVTGLVALMFEADPGLSASEIKRDLIFSARKDEWTGDEVWNQYRGYGKVDALEAIRRITSVSDEANGGLPDAFSLSQNYPNPFNNSTIIEYTIPNQIGVQERGIFLDVYDLRGRMVCRLFQGIRNPGQYRISWTGQDNHGNIVASGVYVYRLNVGETVLSRKMVLLQ